MITQFLSQAPPGTVATTQPTFLAQYGPLIAALIALFGALITLLVSGRRAAQESRVRREDDYRAAARTAVATTLLAARVFYRQGYPMCNPQYFILLGYEGATRLRDHADDAMSSMDQALISARLLALDENLQVKIDNLAEAFNKAAAAVHEASDAFWERRRPGVVWEQREARWSDFLTASADLQIAATSTLAPTVRTKYSSSKLW